MATRPFALERTLTYRLNTLNKLTDRGTQQAYLGEAGIALGEGRCLSVIAAFGPLSVNELATRANLNKGQASRAAQALVAAGHVSKTSRRDEVRGVRLTLTPQGTKLWERLRPVIARRNDEIAACLDEAEREQLDRLVDKLLAHARGAAPTADEPVA